MSRTVFRSTGSKEIAAAKRIAAQIIESFWSDAGRGAEKLKLRSDTASIGELIARHTENAKERDSTIRGNARSLRLLVQTVHGGDPDEKPSSVLRSRISKSVSSRASTVRRMGGTQSRCCGGELRSAG